VPVETNRSLGGIGAIFSLLGIISTIVTFGEYLAAGNSSSSSVANFGLIGITGIVGLLVFVGFILFLVAMWGFSKDYNEKQIFNNIIYGIVGAIVTVIVVGVVWLIFVITSLFSVPGLNPSTSANAFLPYSAPLIAAISVATLVWAIFIVKAYNLLGDKSGVPLFRTGAKILLAGVILNIVVSVVFAALAISGLIDGKIFVLASVPGGILNYVSEGVFAMSFFRIKAQPAQAFSTSPLPATSIQERYCPNCGTRNQLDSVYCIRCGQKL
jgi:uncharacterized membrane protein